MSVSLNVTFIKPKDYKYYKMKAIYDNCIELDVDVPEEVYKYFGNEQPIDEGVVERLVNRDTEVFEYDYCNVSIDVENLTRKYPDVKLIKILMD